MSSSVSWSCSTPPSSSLRSSWTCTPSAVSSQLSTFWFIRTNNILCSTCIISYKNVCIRVHICIQCPAWSISCHFSFRSILNGSSRTHKLFPFSSFCHVFREFAPIINCGAAYQYLCCCLSKRPFSWKGWNWIWIDLQCQSYVSLNNWPYINCGVARVTNKQKFQ